MDALLRSRRIVVANAVSAVLSWVMLTLAYYWGGPAHVLVGIVVLLVFVALITAMVLFVARLLGGGSRMVLAPAEAPSPAPREAPYPPPGAQPSALEILGRRLASGEITIEQYDEVRAKLER
jgi:uncharacterized membrane protein